MKMMAQVLYGPKDMRFEQREVPELAPHDVRIKVKYCGICGTDYSIYSGEAGFWREGLIRVPMIFGHEYSGIIDGVGKSVEKFKVGDRVVADTGVSCGVCEECLSGNYTRCSKVQAVGTVLCRDGGYAEYAVMPERHVFGFSDKISFEEAALNEPVATATFANMRAGIEPGDTVLITGTGPIGLGGIQTGKLMGASKVCVAGRKRKKLDVARELGADGLIDLSKEELTAAAMELTGRKGFDRMIEATGSCEILQDCFGIVRSGGCVCTVAFYDRPLDRFDIDRLAMNNITLTGAGGSPNVGPLILKYVQERKIDCRPMITSIVDLKDAHEALRTLKEKSEENIKILIKC